MLYTVTFYALHSDLRETVVTVHQVAPGALPAYTEAPRMTLAAIRKIKREPQPVGFRVIDDEGEIVLDYREDVGHG